MPIDNPALEAELDRRLSGLSLCCQSLQQVEQDHSKKRKGEDRFYASPPRKCPSLHHLFTLPAVYCLLPHKTTKTYLKMLKAIKDLKPSFSPSSLVVDFEAAAIKAFRTVFPGIQVTGCFFHLAQSQRRQIDSNKDLKGLKSQLRKDKILNLQVRMIRAMAFVPLDKILEVWGDLTAVLDRRPDPMRNWFEVNYVGRQPFRGSNLSLFSQETWNVHARLMADQPKTNNSVEAFHSALVKLFGCAHPTMWKFIETLQMYQLKVDADIVNVQAGRQIRRVNKRWTHYDETKKKNPTKKVPHPLMADRFVSADQLEEARRKRQEEWERVRKPDDPEEAPEEEHDSRSLYERLQEARGKKQSEYEEERKMKNMMRGLDSDETDFLSHVDDLKAKQEVLRKKEERELIKKCKERATFKSAGVPSLNKLRPAHSGTGKKAVSEQAQLLGAVIRKRTISDVEDEPKKRKKLVEESALPTNIKVIGVIPGMQQYSPSSDSSNSDSEDDRNSLPVLVQNAGTAKKGNGCEEESDLVMTSQDVASHYNAVPERGLAERTQSRIFYLRNFNNWTKSMLINEFLEKLRKEGCNRPRVLDLCCGKGGDLLKWKQGNISSIVMTDVADISLKQCESRYNEMKDRGRNDRQELFTATFLHADASTERLLPQLESDTQFDIASCQFALHYSFATEEQARQMLQNATENIRTGGYFIGTLPDADVMYWCIKQGENGKYVNDVCSLEYDDKSVNFETHIPPLFGAKFHFTLDQVVNCPEFLVHFDLLVQMMDELGFQLVLRKRFTEAVPYFLKEQGHSARALLGRMQALEPFPPENDAKLMGPEAEYKDARDEIEEKEGKQDWEGNHRTIGTLSKSEWEVASMYLVFAFQRVSQ